MKTTLKTFIQEVRKITIKEAALELGYTRPYLTEICNGLPGGRKLAIKAEKWSNGFINRSDIMFPKG